MFCAIPARVLRSPERIAGLEQAPVVVTTRVGPRVGIKSGVTLEPFIQLVSRRGLAGADEARPAAP